MSEMVRLYPSLLLLVVATHAAVDPLTFFGGVNNDVYLEWVEQRSRRFSNAVFLKTTSNADDTGTAFHWSVNDTTIEVAVAARAEGWVGLGFSENGGMRGADIVLFSKANPHRLTDAHVLQELQPLEDACQNWELQYSQTSGGFLIFEGARRLDTGDTQDRKIMNDTDYLIPAHTLISAWGDSPNTWTNHGPHNRLRARVRLFGDENAGDQAELFRRRMAAEAEGSLFLGADNFEIPNVETTYKLFCFDASYMESFGVPLDRPLHVIGFEPVVEERVVDYVHHFSSVWYTAAFENGDCTRDLTSGEPFYGWAPGSAAFDMPTQFGMPLGASGGVVRMDLEIHYNNPKFVQGVLDSSGVRIYWTSEKRPQDVGSFGFADPLTILDGQPVGGGLSKHQFDCPSSCSALALSDGEPVTVFRENFHMHQTGTRATNVVIRNGEVVHRSSVEFFDFEQSGQQTVQQEPFQIFPGDAFQSTCYFDSPDDNQTFGFSSQDEMCIVSLAYYPRKLLFGRFVPVCSYNLLLPGCRASYNSTSLTKGKGKEDAQTAMHRIFGNAMTNADAMTNALCLSPDELAPPDVSERAMTTSNSPMRGGDVSFAETSTLLLTALMLGTAYL